MISGQTFQEVLHTVHGRADAQLPDSIVHVADLRMTPEGFLRAPGTPLFRMNDWSRKQIAAQVGVRWSSWFSPAITGEERADEMNRRLSRSPGEMKIRAWKDESGEAEGIARAFLSPRFTPIDDRRIFDRLAATMRGVLDEYRFTRVEFNDSTSQFTAAHMRARDVKGDLHHPGWTLRSSEVGGAAFTLDDFWLRLACLNGLLVEVGSKRLLYRTHRAIDDDHLAAAMVIALGKLPDRWDAVVNLMLRAREANVPHPDTAVAAVLDSPEVPRALMEEAQALALRDDDHTKYGVVQAITFVAHERNTDPDIRFAMERLAGSYLAAA